MMTVTITKKRIESIYMLTWSLLFRVGESEGLLTAKPLVPTRYGDVGCLSFLQPPPLPCTRLDAADAEILH